MNPQVARRILAVAGTMSPDPFARVVAHLQLIGQQNASRYEPWWQWTMWLAYGVLAVSSHSLGMTVRARP